MNNNMNCLYDYGPNPLVLNIERATLINNRYRTVLWTGNNLQLTVMSIPVGESIGLEIHPNVDQFIRIEQGEGIVKMGKTANNLIFRRNVMDNCAILIPQGTWHDIENAGNIPLKLYSIYAPPNHPNGTIQQTKQDEE